MTIELEDKTGELTSSADRHAAIGAVKSALVRSLTQLIPVAPELAVNLTNILRCLQEHDGMRDIFDLKKETT